MKSVVIMGIFLVAAFTLALIDGPKDDIARAKKLWGEMSGYNQWSVAPGSNRMMPDQAPHGHFATIYANDIAVKTLGSDAEAMPDGAVFVKDNFDSVKRLSSVTVMSKQDGAWFWVVYKPEGQVERAGALEDCLSCHAGAQRDMVFTWSQQSQGWSK